MNQRKRQTHRFKRGILFMTIGRSGFPQFTTGRLWRKAVVEVCMSELASSGWLDLAQTSS
jgi:hypothetical protein